MSQGKDFIEVCIRPIELLDADNLLGNDPLGDDIFTSFSSELSIYQLKQFINSIRPHIPICRQIIHVYRYNSILVKPLDDWKLRRIGLLPNDILTVSPTMNSTWLFNDMEYYENKYITDISYLISNSMEKKLTLNNLDAILTKRVPFKKLPLIVFLRKFPDFFLVYTDISTHEKIISMNVDFKYPLFLSNSEKFYDNKIFPLENFPFDDYKDVDMDTKLVTLDFKIQSKWYCLQLVNCNKLARFEKYIIPDSICYLFFNEKKIGTLHTKNMLNFQYEFAHFIVEIPSDVELYSCILHLEIWTDNIDGKRLLGDIRLDKDDLIDFFDIPVQAITNLRLNIKNNHLISYDSKSLPNITILRGRCGYEIELLSVYDITLLETISMTNVEMKQIDNLDSFISLTAAKMQFGELILSNPWVTVNWNDEEIFKSAQSIITNFKFFQLNQIIALPLDYVPNPLEDDEFMTLLSNATLELILWIKIYDVKIKEARDYKLGSIKINDVKDLLLHRFPFARYYHKELNSIIHRKPKCIGFINFKAGFSGLNILRPSFDTLSQDDDVTKYEFSILSIENITKFDKLYYTIEWSNIEIEHSNPYDIQVTEDGYGYVYPKSKYSFYCDANENIHNSYYTSSTKNSSKSEFTFPNSPKVKTPKRTNSKTPKSPTFQFNLKSSNHQRKHNKFVSCYLQIDIFEYIPSKGRNDYGEYIGQIYLDENDLLDAFGNDYSTQKTFALNRSSQIDKNFQSMVRGNVVLRCGQMNTKLPDERIIYIKHFEYFAEVLNLQVYHFYVNVIWIDHNQSKTIIGETPILFDQKFPVWDDNHVFLIDIVSSKARINSLQSENMNRQNESNLGNMLILEVYSKGIDDKDILCGSAKLHGDDLKQFLDCIEPQEIILPVNMEDPTVAKNKTKKEKLKTYSSGKLCLGTCGIRFNSMDEYRKSLFSLDPMNQYNSLQHNTTSTKYLATNYKNDEVLNRIEEQEAEVILE